MTPVNNTIVVAIIMALTAGSVPLDYLADMVSISTLTAFIVVALGRVDPAPPRTGPALRLPGAGLPW